MIKTACPVTGSGFTHCETCNPITQNTESI